MPYFGGTGKSDHGRSFVFLSLPIIIVVIMVEMKGLRFMIISGDDCISSHGCVTASYGSGHVTCAGPGNFNLI